MNVNRQVARSASTRAKLIKAARTLFARRGYAGVATEEIVRRAGVTRGALYHQFQTKEDLFLAVYEQVERDLTERVDQRVLGLTSPFAAMRAGIRAFLEECRAPEVQRIVLIDGPAVLGWERWRAIDERYGMGLLRLPLRRLATAGRFDPTLVDGFAHMLLAALGEVALVAARADDGVAATREAQRAIDALLERLLAPQGGA